ncbi:hypothetical protein [Novosphingobium sp.]|uniref:hypothetical protein n=1 Tax=Novosphingobium sp. TaxID=1874826 RepID=UPI0025F1B26C|nr:hypothetical protein [Novosphingobium sp.]MCC6925193.1 hypothetical protein [Novosphingobium sp.]
MASGRKSIERADEIQGSTLAGWYLGVCFLICLAGGLWFANSSGVFDQSYADDPAEAYKQAARVAAKKAAAREEQARLAAAEDARNMAEAASRTGSAAAPKPTPDAKASAEAVPEVREPVTGADAN